ncbi:hypothetical protein D3C78_1913270 [compost metagenome]
MHERSAKSRRVTTTDVDNHVVKQSALLFQQALQVGPFFALDTRHRWQHAGHLASGDRVQGALLAVGIDQ